MIHDLACPPGFTPPAAAIEARGIAYTAGQWTPHALSALVAHLEAAGGPALAGIDRRRLLAAWCDVVERFRDPASAESETVRPALARSSGLSDAGLAAALDAVLGGVARPHAERLFAARHRFAGDGGAAGELVAIILAGNLPALAVQPLLPALVLGRPVLLKSSLAEPLFTPAFVRALHRALPALESAVAAVAWKGGDEALEKPVLTGASTVLVYGDQPALDSIVPRVNGSCVAYGPKTSLAVVAGEVDIEAVADGLARDIALLDQRGCLSVQAVYTDGPAADLAHALAAALTRRAAEWPAGALDPSAVAGVQQARLDARLRGLLQPELDLATGTVIVDPLPEFRISPGLRTVRVLPLALEEVLPRLAPWRGRLQGAALAGSRAWQLESGLAALGVSRCAAPGTLQAADALWHNGGLHPLEALGTRAALRRESRVHR